MEDKSVIVNLADDKVRIMWQENKYYSGEINMPTWVFKMMMKAVASDQKMGETREYEIV